MSTDFVEASRVVYTFRVFANQTFVNVAARLTGPVESSSTVALVGTNGVVTRGVHVTVVTTADTLVQVTARCSIPDVALPAFARERTNGVIARGIHVTIVGSVEALVNIWNARDLVTSQMQDFP